MRQGFGRYGQGFPGLQVSQHPRSPVDEAEAPEAADLDPSPRGQGSGDSLQNLTDCNPDIRGGQSGNAASESGDQFGFRHAQAGGAVTGPAAAECPA